MILNQCSWALALGYCPGVDVGILVPSGCPWILAPLLAPRSSSTGFISLLQDSAPHLCPHSNLSPLSVSPSHICLQSSPVLTVTTGTCTQSISTSSYSSNPGPRDHPLCTRPSSLISFGNHCHLKDQCFHICTPTLHTSNCCLLIQMEKSEPQSDCSAARLALHPHAPVSLSRDLSTTSLWNSLCKPQAEITQGATGTAQEIPRGR